MNITDIESDADLSVNQNPTENILDFFKKIQRKAYETAFLLKILKVVKINPFIAHVQV